MKNKEDILTKGRWDDLLKQKETEIQEILKMRNIDPDSFEDYCRSAVIKYKTKTETFEEYILNSPIWEVAETLISIEYGRRPR